MGRTLRQKAEMREDAMAQRAVVTPQRPTSCEKTRCLGWLEANFHTRRSALSEGRETVRRHASRALRVYHDEDQRTRAEHAEDVAVQTPMEQQQVDALALVAET